MVEFTLRDAGPDEAGRIVPMVRRMVADMAGHGGHAAAEEDAPWDMVRAEIAKDLASPRTKFVVAQARDGEWVGVAGAELIRLGGAFAPKETLHISAVYVIPHFRRGGVAGRLLTMLLDWGRVCGAVECDLNVLANNPARALYEKHGFGVFEVKMTRPLPARSSEQGST
jgi:ribosomal protein S18 acetylase RimI-like enzyme